MPEVMRIVKLLDDYKTARERMQKLARQIMPVTWRVMFSTKNLGRISIRC